jgi:acyl-coenzyme A thioesterase PaaI-like protein
VSGEDVVADARILRRGRGVVFLDVALSTRDGRPTCRGQLTYQTTDDAGQPPRLRAEHALLPAPTPLAPPTPGHRLFRGYVHELGITPLHERPGRVRLHMPSAATRADERGHVHAGALASIVDIAAVTASWSLVPRREGARGSTIGMQVSYPSAAASAVVADAHVQQRAEELLFSTLHVTTVDAGHLVAMAQVSYRLLEPRAGD